jgi:soluble P-type ATPase
MVIQIGCAGEGQVSDRLQKNFGERLKCGEHRCRRRNQAGPACPKLTLRGQLLSLNISGPERLPPISGGLECIIVIDDKLAATFRLRDAPRAEGRFFIQHLGPKHQFQRIMILSGDRESEVRYLAEQIGITEIHAEQSPEQKLAIVRHETALAKTLYVGDGINDAPAMMAATVGMAIGQNTDVTAEAADVVAMENSLKKVDEFMHISRRMRCFTERDRRNGAELGRHDIRGRGISCSRSRSGRPGNY